MEGCKGRRPQGKTTIHSRAWDVVTAPRRAQEIEIGGGGGGSLSTEVDSGTSSYIELVNPLVCPRAGWVSRWWYSWDDVLFGKSAQFMEFGNIYNAYICSISIVMEIFLSISWKMLLIVYVCFAFSPHNNHFFNWSRVFDRAWLWSSSGEIVDLQCGTIILFPFSRDWLISFILEREFEIAPKLQPPNKRLCDLTWKSRETGRFLLPSLSSLSVRGEFYSFHCY